MPLRSGLLPYVPFTRAILCLAIAILVYVFNSQGHRERIVANHKQLPYALRLLWGNCIHQDDNRKTNSRMCKHGLNSLCQHIMCHVYRKKKPRLHVLRNFAENLVGKKEIKEMKTQSTTALKHFLLEEGETRTPFHKFKSNLFESFNFGVSDQPWPKLSKFWKS